MISNINLKKLEIFPDNSEKFFGKKFFNFGKIRYKILNISQY